MTEFFISCVAYLLIWIAVDYKRTPECNFSIFSKEGLVQFILITLGGSILISL